jgi:phospholipase/carboxylesterase
MRDDDDALLDATTALVPPLLTALDALAFAGRHLHPPQLARIAAALADFDLPLRDGRARFDRVPWPETLGFFRGQLLIATDAALAALDGVAASATDPNGVLRAYRAMRHSTRAVEALYPLTFMLPPVSRFFLDADRRGDDALVQRIADADAQRDDVGILNVDNARDSRGGVSLYIPEYYDPDTRWPLIVALHGGSGHGADFLWTWLREARTRGCILASPTSHGDTWSLMDSALDGAPLRTLVSRIAQRWSVDTDHILLTGMSDGGTFTLVTGLLDRAPFTHLAPISGSFHPMLLDGAADIRGLPIYLVHGALDWMFPVEMAHMARDALSAAGAAVTFREIDDLSHTYPRDENPKILDWLMRDRATSAGRT